MAESSRMRRTGVATAAVALATTVGGGLTTPAHAATCKDQRYFPPASPFGFSDVTRDFVVKTSGCVVSTWNITWDVQWNRLSEKRRSQTDGRIPHPRGQGRDGSPRETRPRSRPRP
jgi:hypothetical protein